MVTRIGRKKNKKRKNKKKMKRKLHLKSEFATYMWGLKNLRKIEKKQRKMKKILMGREMMTWTLFSAFRCPRVR